MTKAPVVLERPVAPEAEQAVLGCCLISTKAVQKVLTSLECEEFFFACNQHVYRGIEALAKLGVIVDEVTLTEKLREQGTLEAINGKAYLRQLYNSTPTAALLDTYIAPVRDTALKRTILEKAEALSANVYDTEATGPELAEDFVTVFQSLAASRGKCEGRTARTAFAERRQELREGRTPELIKLHLPDLDDVLKIHPGDLIVVAGILNTGKSATMLNWLMSACFHEVPCELWSLEMMERECLDRMAAAKSGVGATRITEASLTPAEQKAVDHWMGVLEDLPLRIYDVPPKHVEELRGQLRTNAGQFGTRLVFVDQLRQLNSRGKHDTETLRLGHVAQQLKQSARENNNAIILLHQLNRAGDDQGRPEVKHLRQSGMIAEDCDAVVLLYQPERKKEAQTGKYADEIPLEWIVARQRNGPKGVVKRTFKLSTQRIFEWSEQFDDDDAYEQTGRGSI